MEPLITPCTLLFWRRGRVEVIKKEFLKVPLNESFNFFSANLRSVFD